MQPRTASEHASCAPDLDVPQCFPSHAVRQTIQLGDRQAVQLGDRQTGSAVSVGKTDLPYCRCRRANSPNTKLGRPRLASRRIQLAHRLFPRPPSIRAVRHEQLAPRAVVSGRIVVFRQVDPSSSPSRALSCVEADLTKKIGPMLYG